jgi:flagellar basal body-associated protein FliL
MAVIEDIVRPNKAVAPTARDNRRILLMSVVVVVLLALLAGLTLFFVHNHRSGNPVPADVQSAVNFPIYYPRQSNLPAGYTLDTTTIRLAQPGVVIYSVRKGGQQMVFSEEETPDGSVIDKFTSSYIPLHNTITTDLGKAAIGAAGQGAHLQTVVSLPIAKGPWLIITAPANTKQSEVKQILQSLVK